MNETEILDHVKAHGGITLTPQLEPTTGLKFVASLFGHELRVALKAMDTFDLKETLKHYKKLARKVGAQIGLWIDNGQLFIDVSKNFDTVEECKQFAQSNRQLAYYDALNGQSIRMEA